MDGEWSFAGLYQQEQSHRPIPIGSFQRTTIQELGNDIQVAQVYSSGKGRTLLASREYGGSNPICRLEGILMSGDQVHGDLKAVSTQTYLMQNCTSPTTCVKFLKCNILVSSDGVAKLADFDHSIITDCSLVFSATTHKGGGTVRWMVGAFF